jgi:AcrR family transcriptional regulator
MVNKTKSANSTDTRARILRAAFRRLLEDGYVRLSTRDIAAEAGVNHALIHYYFGTKDKLVVAALDDANSQLIERQTRMYASRGGVAAKWAQAREFYEQDLASGFVRVQMELWAAALSNPDLRKDILPRLLAWRSIVEGGVRQALDGYALDLPFSADAIACWVVDFWWGMEFETLLGISEAEAHHQEALDAMQRLLEHLDTQACCDLPHTVEDPPGTAETTGESDGRDTRNP